MLGSWDSVLLFPGSKMSQIWEKSESLIGMAAPNSDTSKAWQIKPK